MATAVLEPTRLTPSLRVVLLAAPVLFVVHWLEESHGFVAWFNAHVDRGITQDMFTGVNQSALVITLVVVALEWFTESAVSMLIAVAWLSCLMCANGIFHVAATIMDGAYMPGVVTAATLYLPYFAWFTVRALRERRAPRGALAVAAVVGAAPMVAHCYLILFERSRLF